MRWPIRNRIPVTLVIVRNQLDCALSSNPARDEDPSATSMAISSARVLSRFVAATAAVEGLTKMIRDRFLSSRRFLKLKSAIDEMSHRIVFNLSTVNESFFFMPIIVNPFHRTLLTIRVHRLALWRMIADVTQRVGDASSELNLILNRGVNWWWVKRWWSKQFA